VAVPRGTAAPFFGHVSRGRDFIVSDMKQKSIAEPVLMTMATASSVNSA